MTSTFRLTKAEFKKIFKRPSIFIMAIILVVTTLLSFAFFKPAEIALPTIIYNEATTSQDYYNYFYSDVNINSKATFDKNFDDTNNIISYFDSINNNSNTLTRYYDDVINVMNLFVADNLLQTKDNYRQEALNAVNNFLNAYKALDNVKDFSDITDNTLNTQTYIIKENNELKEVSTNYYTTKSCEKLLQLQTYLSDTSKYTSKDVADTYVIHNYEKELLNILNNGINFIYTTIKGYSYYFDTFLVQYTTATNTGRNQLTTMKAMRSNMVKVLESLDEYLEKLINYNFPIIIMKKDIYLDLNQRIDDAISILTLSTTDDNNIDKHREVKNNLEINKINSVLNSITQDNTSTADSYIIQTKLAISEINDFKNIQSKVNSNNESILANINELRTDESTINISKGITNYSLLSISYKDIILNKVLLSIADNYDSSVYTKFYGYGFSEFNKYQIRENISLNEYYINNNTYSTEYLNNFSFNQNSGKTTNVYDYMYFTLELCTVIIIFFSIMLVCNLITGETESGTIKLLLVRPYKRAKIITAKLLATIFFVLTFMLFSSVITYIGGALVYGVPTQNVLAIFNSHTAFEISPLMLMLINILTLTFDIIFFVLLAMMISILFKNYAASISCTIVILIINYAMNIMFGGAFWYSILPGMNLHLFKFFGNSFVSLTEGVAGLSGLIQTILTTGIETTMTFWYSFCIYFAYSLVFLTISYSVFQKRDF